MKNKTGIEIIKTILGLLLVFVAITVKAQITTKNGISIVVSATIVSDFPVELTTLNNLVVSGDESAEREIYISPLTSSWAGLMRAKGKPGTQARMTYIVKEVLSNETGMGYITLNYEMSGNAERVQRASNLINTGNAILKFGEDGLYYLWVGGKVDTSNAVSGKYTGQFTIEIEYI